MPERKGRKRRSQHGRRRPGETGAPSAAGTPISEPAASPPRKQSAASDNSIPALRARYAGFIVAVLTMTIGILTLSQGLVGNYATTDAALRIGAGIVLMIVALVIGLLTLVPSRIAAWLRRE